MSGAAADLSAAAPGPMVGADGPGGHPIVPDPAARDRPRPAGNPVTVTSPVYHSTPTRSASWTAAWTLREETASPMR